MSMHFSPVSVVIEVSVRQKFNPEQLKVSDRTINRKIYIYIYIYIYGILSVSFFAACFHMCNIQFLCHLSKYYTN
jgi:hypothetical protein